MMRMSTWAPKVSVSSSKERQHCAPSCIAPSPPARKTRALVEPGVPLAPCQSRQTRVADRTCPSPTRPSGSSDPCCSWRGRAETWERCWGLDVGRRKRAASSHSEIPERDWARLLPVGAHRRAELLLREQNPWQGGGIGDEPALNVALPTSRGLRRHAVRGQFAADDEGEGSLNRGGAGESASRLFRQEFGRDGTASRGGRSEARGRNSLL